MIKTIIRKLTQQDYQVFDTFLKPPTPTSVFLRSNAKKAGLIYQSNQDYSAHYYGAFDDENLQGVMALCWNGSILTQVFNLSVLKKLYDFAVNDQPTFGVKVVLAPKDQTDKFLQWLQIDQDNISLSVTETAFYLDLDQLQIPSKLVQSEWEYRLATMEDMPILLPWNMGYAVEALGSNPISIDEKNEMAKDIASKIALSEMFVLTVSGELVSQAKYNATLPDVVQIGGVWTPPLQRRVGYARGVVAGALIEAKKHQVEKAILFARNPFAIRCYEKLGFEAVARYHLTICKTPTSFKEVTNYEDSCDEGIVI